MTKREFPLSGPTKRIGVCPKTIVTFEVIVFAHEVAALNCHNPSSARHSPRRREHLGTGVHLVVMWVALSRIPVDYAAVDTDHITPIAIVRGAEGWTCMLITTSGSLWQNSGV